MVGSGQADVGEEVQVGMVDQRLEHIDSGRLPSTGVRA